MPVGSPEHAEVAGEVVGAREGVRFEEGGDSFVMVCYIPYCVIVKIICTKTSSPERVALHIFIEKGECSTDTTGGMKNLKLC